MSDFAKELEFAEKVVELNGLLKAKYGASAPVQRGVPLPDPLNPLREQDIFDLAVEAVKHTQERAYQDKRETLDIQRFASDEAFKLIIAELKAEPVHKEREHHEGKGGKR